MKLGLKSYKYHEKIEQEDIYYDFYSIGKNRILKSVEYGWLGEIIFGNKSLELYNFGFGDLVDGVIDDSVMTENNDGRKVFETVLTTVPDFFKVVPNAIFRVGGSDSRPEFPDECIKTCTKCETKEKCRKKSRRIKLYSKFVNINFTELSKEYDFYGAVPIDEQNNRYSIVPYDVKSCYNYIMVKRK